jgi:hypothetical protein
MASILLVANGAIFWPISAGRNPVNEFVDSLLAAHAP